MHTLWTYSGIILVISLVCTTAYPAPDLVIFHNGDYAFGTTTVDEDTDEIVLESEGETKHYTKRQVREVFPGVSKPADGEVVTASKYVISATGMIPQITAPITTRSRLETDLEENPEIIFDVEDGFQVAKIHLFSTNPDFYNRIGSYLVFILENHTTQTWRAVEFRATFYGEEDQLLASKDFYIFRLPASTPDRTPRTVVKLNIPDIPYDLIHRVRIVRKF